VGCAEGRSRSRLSRKLGQRLQLEGAASLRLVRGPVIDAQRADPRGATEIAMWLVFERTRRPDAAYWPGRQALAALDAVAWPLAWVAGTLFVRDRCGLVGAMVVAVAALQALRRLRRALCENHRYFFTTWRWARIVSVVLLVGCLMKLYYVAT